MVVLSVTLSIFLVSGVVKQGGPTVVWSRVKNGGRFDILDFDPDPTKRDSFWIIVIGRTMGWLAEVGVNQCSILKYSSVPTLADCKKTIIYFTIGFSLTQILGIILGLNIYSLYSDCDPVAASKLEKYDGIVAFYILDILKNITGVCGLFMACTFSASLSTLSTTLNSLSGVIYKDFICNAFTKNFTESQAVNIVKSTVVVTGTLCILLSFFVENLGGLFQVALNILSVANGPLLGMFSLGLLIPKANSNGALYGGIVGFISGASLLLTAMYHESNKLLANVVKPISTAGCKFNQTNLENFAPEWTIANATSGIKPNFVVRISFYYYPLITFSITVVFGIIISYLTNKSTNPVDRKLLCSLCHSFLPKISNDVTEDHLLQNLK
ncbi:sodium-coupled monocarboxylate transporter 2-like [Zophobas morio]|uniref:sodium-coupled monocarboxylate transporter 2-like n=1 Tax=Zophobas morio TaxID=2755281 RepID=UPI003082FC90